jgi:hypothetical protein
MNDLLHRVELHSPEQARAILARNLLPWIGEQLTQGLELVVEARLLEDDITAKQRGYLHGGVLTQISKEAAVRGEKFPMEVWKEWYRSQFLGFDVVTCIDPFTGRKLRRRVRKSTEDLGRRSLAEYTERVIAHASTELGLTINPPMVKEVREAMKRYAARGEVVDADTGEITEGVAA